MLAAASPRTREVNSAMSLRCCPLLTPRSLAARRANALKSTGPRSPAGKARVSLNALKHGHDCGPAGRSARLRERLLRAGYRREEALYSEIRSALGHAFGDEDARSSLRTDQMAAVAWCEATGRGTFGTKLECALESSAKGSRFLAQDSRRPPRHGLQPLRYRGEDHWRRIGIAFWVQHRRYLTRERLMRALTGLETVAWPAPNEGLETRIRCRIFRLRRPGYFERLRYGLDPNGDPDHNSEPWRRAARTGKFSTPRRIAVTVSEDCEPKVIAWLEKIEHIRIVKAASEIAGAGHRE